MSASLCHPNRNFRGLSSVGIWKELSRECTWQVQETLDQLGLCTRTRTHTPPIRHRLQRKKERFGIEVVKSDWTSDALGEEP